MKINLNDITELNEEKIELDLNSFFWVWEFKLDNFDGIDIDSFKKYLEKNLVVKNKPIIKINKNKINVETIKINKNLKKDIDLFWEKPKKDDFTIDFAELEKPKELRKKHFDLFVKRKYDLKFFKKFFRKILNKIDNFIFKIPKKVYNTFLVVFLILALFFTYAFWLKFLVKNAYYKMQNLLETSTWNWSFDSKIKEIKLDFYAAWILYSPLNVIDKIHKSEKIENLWYLIKAWKKLTEVLDDSVVLKNKVLAFVDKKKIENIYFTNLLENINFKWFLLKTSDKLREVWIYFYKVWDLWDEKLNQKLQKAAKKIFNINKKIDLVYRDYDILLDLLWHKKLKKYLILFQNSDEIRPTWGFSGSLWLLSIFRWKIEKFDKKDVYYYDRDLYKNFKREQAPKWLDQITETFWLRDANYFVEVPRSSRKIKYFMKKAWVDIDWVIYVNQNTLLELLDVIDWVKLKTINQYITSENFSQIISTLVESKKFKKWIEGSPKQILFDFMQAFYTKLVNKKEYSKYLKVILRNFSTRDIMIYSFNDDKILKDFWVDWSINFKETLDFAYPIFTSISWNKSDRYIKRIYKKQYFIAKNCEIKTKFEIELHHTFSKKDRDEIINYLNLFHITKARENLINIQWAWPNNSYVRVLLPKDAILDNTIAHKEYIPKDKDYKIVDFFMITEKWWKSFHFIGYTLKNPECKKYSYKIYKQPWIREYELLFYNEDLQTTLFEDFTYRQK